MHVPGMSPHQHIDEVKTYDTALFAISLQGREHNHESHESYESEDRTLWSVGLLVNLGVHGLLAYGRILRQAWSDHPIREIRQIRGELTVPSAVNDGPSPLPAASLGSAAGGFDLSLFFVSFVFFVVPSNVPLPASAARLTRPIGLVFGSQFVPSAP